MPDEQIDHDFMELMSQEHDLLEQLLATIQTALATEPPDRRSVIPLLSELADLAETHFAHEEQGRFLEEAVARVPRLTTRTEGIRRDHENLLEDVQKLRILASSGVESESWWNQIRSDFLKFFQHMQVHEAAEKAILQEAFTDDLGTGD